MVPEKTSFSDRGRDDVSELNEPKDLKMFFEGLEQRLSSPEGEALRRAMLDGLARDFPKTFNLEIAVNFKQGFPFKRYQTELLLYLASTLDRSPLSVDRPIEDVKRRIRGKKILVLGDDIGSLSEILRAYGAEAYGVEYDSRALEIAESGRYAEDGQSQVQVVKGDIIDLAHDDSDLYREVSKHGPFDAIVSNNVFEGGSGLDASIHNFEGYSLEKIRGQERWHAQFLYASQQLLADGGFQLHKARPELNVLFDNRLVCEKPYRAEDVFISAGHPSSRFDVLFFRKNSVIKDKDDRIVWRADGTRTGLQ